MDWSNFHLYQIIIVFIAGAMIYQGGKNLLRQQAGQTWLKFLVRVAVWGGMVMIVLFPNLTNTLAQLIGIADNINAVILTGFIFVFLIIFKLLSAIERLEQQLTLLTRKDSLSHSSTRSHDRP